MPGHFEEDEGTQIVLDSGDLAAAPGWTLLEGTVNRIGPETMLHVEFAHAAGAAPLALQLPDENYWPTDDVHTPDGKFHITSAAVNEVQHINTTGVPTGGHSTLTYTGKAGIAVQWNSSAAQLQTLLDGIFGAGVTVVTAGPLPTQLVVTFTDGKPHGAPVVVDALTGGSTPHMTAVVSTPGLTAGGVNYTGDTSGSDAGPLVCEAVYDPWNGH